MNDKKEPINIGGWLFLVAIGVVLSPIRQLFFLGTTYPPLFTDGSWEALTLPSSESYIPYFGVFLISEILINIAMIIGGFYLIYLFFNKKSNLPKWYFGLALFSTLFIVLDAYVVSLLVSGVEVFDSETMEEIARSFASLIIWSPYLIYSQRSKDTFVK
tara:strand:+ start:1054 stop:1530 length:477 start_codon:yes stop_codon:yes gene_type:complete